VTVLRRKLAEVNACIDRLDSVRQQLHTQLIHAIAHREETCFENRELVR
jgi:hypothetical protein